MTSSDKTFTKALPAVRFTEEGRANSEELVVREAAATIVFNNQELVTLLCSPSDWDCLAVGFLQSEELVATKEEIKKVMVDDRKGIVWVETLQDKNVDTDIIHKRIITSGCGKGASFSMGQTPLQTTIDSDITFSSSDIFKLVDTFQRHSGVYRSTHGVHSAALCDEKQILVFKDDIGRHNAIDKMFGECLLRDIPTEDRIVIISGRISSEMLLKVARRKVPVIVSIAVPTDVGVEWATSTNMTLVGRVRGGRMNVYSGAWRIKP
jgi:FdhD protein